MSSVESEGVTSREKGRAYRAGYPPPPLNALSYDSLRPASIHYNQPVSLPSEESSAYSLLGANRRYSALLHRCRSCCKA